MPARSFIGEMEEAAKRFYATVLRGEVSDENVRAYLRAASQIADVWRQIDDRLAALIEQGAPAWEAYAQLGSALAFIRAARAYHVFLRELLAAATDPLTGGYVPRVTFDQANALAHQIEPNLQHAVAALTDPTYAPDVALPLKLGSRVEADGACPASHLRGMLAAAREIREWAAGLIAEYVVVVRRSGPAPAEIEAHITALQSQLAQADAQLQFGADLAGQVSRGGATEELRAQAERHLWKAMRAYFLLNQAAALPSLLTTTPALLSLHPGKPGARKVYRDHPVRPDDLWRIATPSARSGLRETRMGRKEMKKLCDQMGGVLSARAQEYLDEVEAAARERHVSILGAMASCPYEPLYRARRTLRIAGAHIPAGHEFHWNYPLGRIESAARFERSNDWLSGED